MNPDEIVARLRASKKYGSLCTETLSRIAEWAVRQFPSPRQALKTAKKKLHQISGAYTEKDSQRKIDELLYSLSPEASEADIRSVCLRILTHHASTRERLPHMEKIYSELFGKDFAEICEEPVTTVLDLACGLGPFSLPWMNLPPLVRYTPVDMDCALIKRINRFLKALGRDDRAQCCDILCCPPKEPFDLVLLLKTLPCLERQERGAGVRLLKTIRAQRIVVSFPSRSLGGRRKGMETNYARFMESLLKEWDVEARTMTFPSEIFYLLKP
jgi:16S rRNA (guanine(1405)-N(7))-methyltransferase